MLEQEQRKIRCLLHMTVHDLMMAVRYIDEIYPSSSDPVPDRVVTFTLHTMSRINGERQIPDQERL